MSAPRRTALVTGSARRVGRAIAEGLVADGYDVLIHARDADRALAAAEELGAAGSVGADLEAADSADVIAAAVVSTFGDRGLDLVVNSASSFERVDAWHEAGVDGWRRAMSVNARAPYLVTSTLLPQLRRARGAVINISDTAAHEHWTTFPIHSASKAALESLTLSGARALARDDVRMLAIVPGLILAPDGWSEARIERERAAGTLGSPDELVRTVIALADDRTRTGEIVVL